MAYLGIDEVRNGATVAVQSVGCLAVAVLAGLFRRAAEQDPGSCRGPRPAGRRRALYRLCRGCGGSYALMLGFSLVAGLGFISIDLLTNSVVADVFQGNKNRVLPYVHAFTGVGRCWRLCL